MKKTGIVGVLLTAQAVCAVICAMKNNWNGLFLCSMIAAVYALAFIIDVAMRPTRHEQPDSPEVPMSWETDELDEQDATTDVRDEPQTDCSPPIPPTADGGVPASVPTEKNRLTLVHTDGRRADVRDWRRRG
jgi:hypothetical protein